LVIKVGKPAYFAGGEVYVAELLFALAGVGGRNSIGTGTKTSFDPSRLK
jgi:hypothetical protein